MTVLPNCIFVILVRIDLSTVFVRILENKESSQVTKRSTLLWVVLCNSLLPGWDIEDIVSLSSKEEVAVKSSMMGSRKFLAAKFLLLCVDALDGTCDPEAMVVPDLRCMRDQMAHLRALTSTYALVKLNLGFPPTCGPRKSVRLPRF